LTYRPLYYDWFEGIGGEESDFDPFSFPSKSGFGGEELLTLKISFLPLLPNTKTLFSLSFPLFFYLNQSHYKFFFIFSSLPSPQ
jgi:hypothetical protein